MELGFQKFIVNKDVIFNKKTMLYSKNNESVAIYKNPNIDKQVELKVRPLAHLSQDDTSVQLV